MLDVLERYLIELILLGGFFLAGPLARIIAEADTAETGERKNPDYAFIRFVFRVLFAALLALWVLLFKEVLPRLLAAGALPGGG
ncbi:MAG: hypothetical protein JW832_07320 [Deltaproteobacteria bacterium]|nr:hypothetical protein [Deltaproteobacteria bacterium]